MQVSDWICCQIGAREHYAVPRSILRCGGRVQLVTDVWAGKGTGWLPRRWQQRRHSEIDDSSVTAWNLSALALQARMTLQRRSLWRRNMAVNNWFQRKVCAVLPALVTTSSSPVTVFAYSYAARRIFELARSLGCHTVLGQIDPGPVEMRLVKGLEAEAGVTGSEWPPDEYWSEWRDECHAADVIVVNSEWSRSALLDEGLPAERLHVIPLAYELMEAVPREVKVLPVRFSRERPLRVLFLGQILRRKGIRELAEAVRHLNSAPIEWTFVGDGDQALMAELRQLEHCIVVGAIARGDVARYYQSADVFVLPTHSDGFALTQLEAAAYGLPIVASQHCGDVVVDGHNGIRLADVSVSCIVGAFARLSAAPELVERLARGAREADRFSLADVGQRLLRLPLSEMAGQSSSTVVRK